MKFSLWLWGILITSSVLEAGDFDVLVNRPVTDRSPYMGLWEVRGLTQNEWYATTSLHAQAASYRVLQNGRVDSEIIGRSMVQFVGFHYGILGPRLEVGFQQPIGLDVAFQDPQSGTARIQDKTLAGDGRLNLKVPLVPGRVTLVPFMMLPWGQSRYYFGTKEVSGGFLTAFESQYRNIFKITGNLGLHFRESYQFRDMNIAHQIVYGVGMAWMTGRLFTLSSEFLGRTNFESPFGKKKENPCEVLLNMHLRGRPQWWELRLGGGYGVIYGAGVPEYRMILGLAFRGEGFKLGL